jgi:single-stranded-DNA-specific exonuclease
MDTSAKEWILPPPDADCPRLAAAWNVPPTIAQLLINRGIRTQEDGRSFLRPQLKDLHTPDTLPGTREAAEIIADAVRRHQKIVLFGDYDVDGIAGISILWHLLRAAGRAPSFYVPHRLDEGYGLNSEALRNMAADGAELIITVDCGVGSIDEARVAAECGLQLIITDHHAPGEALPRAAAIVHPACHGDYPNPNLCGAGVAHKLAWAVAQQLCRSERVTPDFRRLLLELMPLVALGTIADVVPLLGENRALSRHGLAMLKETRIPGLVALMESANLTGGRISGYDVGFKLAPRLNAAGRMGHARLAVELLTRADLARAREIALYLEEHNRARQAKERQILKQACEWIEQRNLACDACRGIVLASEKWHAGVIGIVAARIVERYCRPTVLIAMDNGVGQGSARSIPALPMHDALAACSAHLAQFGGHAMAAGLRIEADHVKPFTDAFIEHANNRLTGADLQPRLRLDTQVALPDLDMPTVQAMLNLGPFGEGNPPPRLATDWVDLAHEPRCVGKNREHLSAVFTEGNARLRAIAFGRGALEAPLKDARRCRLAFEPIINEFEGRRTVELRVIDLRFPEAGPPGP